MLEMNYDCFRDVLQYLKDNLKHEYDEDTDSYLHTVINWKSVFNDPAIKEKYTPEEITYTFENLVESNYIHAKQKIGNYPNITYLLIDNITPSGQQFLNIANDNTTWSHVKNGFKSMKGFSLDVIKSVVSGISAYLIQKNLMP